jgi:predicted nucleic acid-binding Zn ribbon protein
MEVSFIMMKQRCEAAVGNGSVTVSEGNGNVMNLNRNRKCKLIRVMESTYRMTMG